MPQKLIVMNWKMNPSNLKQALSLARVSDKKQVILCPPLIFLNEIKNNIKKAEIGAQNSFWEEKGAFTGEISSLMLKKIKCKYVIVGHSERRKIFNENDSVVNKKMKSILKNNLKPILCIGETKKEKQNKETEKVLKKQLSAALKGLSLASKQLIIAYEPIWAIGTGKSCEFKEAEKTRVFIEKYLKQKFSIKKSIILYGGSVNSENCLNYLKKSFFDGFLVGGASLKEKEVKKILNLVCKS